MKTEDQKIHYLPRLFDETYIKDIIDRHRVDKIQELNGIINIIASCIGSPTNPSRILKTFKSSIQSDISLNTIRQYIEYLKNAFPIHESYRYDITKEESISAHRLNIILKMLDSEMSVCRLGKLKNPTYMENIIYNELRLRGYRIDTGIATKGIMNATVQSSQKQLEVDFILKVLYLFPQ